MSRLAKMFGFENPTEDGLRLARTLAVLVPCFSIAFQMSTTFYMIYIAESLGNGDYLTGLGIVGALVAIQLVIQTVLDYPTGAIGDWIGQRYVIASALLCYAGAFFLTSLLTTTTPLYIPVLIYIFLGVGSSQESGAWAAWFDNNYRVAMPQDEKREQYGVFWARINMVSQVCAAIIIIPGSLFALILGRTWVFQLQAVISVGLSGLVMLMVRDLPEVEKKRDERPDLGEYIDLLKGGVKFVGSSKFFLLLFVGELIFFCTGPVWGSLLLWPFYFSYLSTDIAVSTFRTLIFWPLAFVNERGGMWSKKYDGKKWIPRFRAFSFQGPFFFAMLTVLLFLLPPMPTTQFVSLFIPFTNVPLMEIPITSIIPVIIIGVLFVTTSLFGSAAGILTIRIIIDVVPNRIRNSMYSLRTTSIIAGSVPFILFFGWFTPVFGFGLSFILMGIVTTVGTGIIRWSLKHEIPKVKDLEILKESDTEAEELAIEAV